MRFLFTSSTCLITLTLFSNFVSAEEKKNNEVKTPQVQNSSARLTNRKILDRLEASVNASLILQSDIRKFREVVELRSQLDPLFSGHPLAAKGKNATDSEIVEFLINDRLITQQYPKTDAEVEQEINSIQANNHLTRAELKKALSDKNFKFDDYFELIRDSSSKRDLIDRDIRTKVNITEDDVKNYFFNKVAHNPNAPRSYHIELISFSFKSYISPSAALKAAQSALKKIESGETFEDVAKQMSDDATASSGGDLGTLTEDQMMPIIRNEVKKLQIGKVSGVFGGAIPNSEKRSKPSGRYYIVKLLDIKSNESERFERMKDEIRNQLIASEYQHQISLWLERQRQSAFIHRAGEPSIKEIPITR